MVAADVHFEVHFEVPFEVRLLAYVLFWSSFAVKPLIYVLTNRFFKDAFFASFTWKSKTYEISSKVTNVILSISI